MRPKWSKNLRARYVAIHIHDKCGNPFKSLIDTYISLFGRFGLGLSGLREIRLDRSGEAELLIVRVWHKFLTMLRAAVALMECDQKPVQAHVIAVSGTIKALQKKLSKGHA